MVLSDANDILMYPGIVLVLAAMLAINWVMSSAFWSVSLMYTAVDVSTFAEFTLTNPDVGSVAVVLSEKT